MLQLLSLTLDYGMDLEAAFRTALEDPSFQAELKAELRHFYFLMKLNAGGFPEFPDDSEIFEN